MIDLKDYPTSALLNLYSAIKEEMKKRKIAANLAARKSFVKTLKPTNFKNEDQFTAAVRKANGSRLLSVPALDQKLAHRIKYLPSLISQDWSKLFESYDNNDRKYYVYAHVNPLERVFVTTSECGGNYRGNPFYIGKGSGNRARDLKRNQGHGEILRKLIAKGLTADDVVHIVKDDMTEREAMELEAKLIYFFGTVYERDTGSQLYNLDKSVRPVFVGAMQELGEKAMAKLLADEKNLKALTAPATREMPA